MLDPRYIRWQKNLLDSLNIGGRWGIPRSTTIVVKVSEDSVRIEGEEQEPLLRPYIEAAGYRVIDADLGVPDGQHRRQ